MTSYNWKDENLYTSQLQSLTCTVAFIRRIWTLTLAIASPGVRNTEFGIVTNKFIWSTNCYVIALKKENYSNYAIITLKKNNFNYASWKLKWYEPVTQHIINNMLQENLSIRCSYLTISHKVTYRTYKLYNSWTLLPYNI